MLNFRMMYWKNIPNTFSLIFFISTCVKNKLTCVYLECFLPEKKNNFQNSAIQLSSKCKSENKKSQTTHPVIAKVSISAVNFFIVIEPALN